ncbi:MAG TPA: SDR family oxidoreductase [Noviherbaspirillum sp.]|nr:SDR family oxidoreductase [Noviherbaspirillum sp.]
MRRKLSDAVVVLTGASSGIGRATAQHFADKGATLVLAARDASALEETARECRERGATALAVTTDVSREQEVNALAQRALDSFGRIDIWINNAAVCAFGRIDEVPIDVIHRVIETNLMGYVYGTRAALAHMRPRGRGTIIFIDSIVTSSPQPYTGAYVISKAGIRSLSDCLRMELLLEDNPDIDICSIMPESIDTPLFHQAANYTGRAIQTLRPLHSPHTVAREIVRMAERPRRTAFAGTTARWIAALHTMVPWIYERFVARHIYRNLLMDKPAPPTEGNLYHPMPEHTSVTGGWREHHGTSIGKLALAGAALAIPVALWGLANRTRHLPPARGLPHPRRYVEQR